MTNVHLSDGKFHVSDEGHANKANGMGTVTCVENGNNVMMTTDDCSDDDSELEEDQAAIDHRQQLTGDALPSVVQIDNLENQIYQCAPGQHNIPRFILLDKDFEVLAFPDLFPDGTEAYH